MGKYILITVVFLLCGCDNKECEEWGIKKETTLYPIFTGMINNIPQYTYIYQDLDTQYCTKYKED